MVSMRSRMKAVRSSLQAGAQIVDQADQFDAGLPGKKFADMLVDDGFRARNFAFAHGSALLHDAAEIVEVIEIHVVESRRPRARCCVASRDP